MRIDKQKVRSPCPCFNLIDSCCNLTDTINESPCDTMLTDCPLPLVSALKIHGRLIDTDCVTKILQDTLDNYFDNYNDGKIIEKLVVDACKQFIEH